MNMLLISELNKIMNLITILPFSLMAEEFGWHTQTIRNARIYDQPPA